MEWSESGCAFFSGMVRKWFCVVAFIFNGVFELVVAVFIGWPVWAVYFQWYAPGFTVYGTLDVSFLVCVCTCPAGAADVGQKTLF